MPRSLDGSDDIDNLALACRRYNFAIGVDPETQCLLAEWTTLYDDNWVNSGLC
jgi:hypothetical protein